MFNLSGRIRSPGPIGACSHSTPLCYLPQVVADLDGTIENVHGQTGL